MTHAPGDPADRGKAEEFLDNMAATLARGIVELPAFPQVVIKVQEVLKNPNYTARMFAQPISADPLLASRLLNMANSAAFNATGRVIIDLGIALTRLGAQKVYSVVLAHAMQDIRRTESLRKIAVPLDELWSESVTVAHFCDAVAKRTSLHIQDAFVVGLLHLMGRFYILARCAEQDPSKERIALSSDLVDKWHPTIGGAVLRNWQMSEAVCEAVAAQGDSSATHAGPPMLADVLVAGVRLARRLRNPHETASLSLGGVLARLNLSIEACGSLVAEAETEVRALNRALRP
jgi:HD-like signal output (HDOD) protein